MKKIAFNVLGMGFLVWLSASAVAGDDLEFASAVTNGEVFPMYGMVRLCKAEGAPSSPNGGSLVYKAKNMVLYQNPTGQSNDALSVRVGDASTDSATRQSKNPCSIALVTINQNAKNEPLPKKGTKWYGVMTDKGVESGVANGVGYTKNISVNVLLTAEAITDFSDPTVKIKICRRPGVSEYGDKVTIPFAKGVQFTGIPKREGGPASNIVLTLAKDAKLPRRPRCVVADAVISSNYFQETLNKKLLFGYSGEVQAGQYMPDLWVTVVKLPAH